MNITEDVSGCLRAQEHGRQPIVAGLKGGQGKGNIAFQEEIAATLQAEGSGIEPTVYDARGNGNGEVAPTMTGDHQNRITDYTAIVSTYQEVTCPLMANSHPGSYCGQDAYSDMLVTQNVEVSGLDCRNARENGDLCGTLQCKPNGGFSYNCIHPVRINQTVRRLTPLECERLQGYPDGWTDIGEWIDSKGKKHKAADSPRYKALGNSIALPFWFWLLRRISAQYERPATLGSLFDGIGGFPLCWERCNGKGTALWASEIEEFPMAVTKMKTMKKKTLPTYTILIRTPAGTQTIIETNDFAKARRTYAQYKGSCRLCIDGRELHILDADELMNDHSDKVMEQIFIPHRTKKTEDIHALKPAR